MSRLIVIVLFLVIAETCAAWENVESLIDKLIEISKPGYGYSSSFSGTEFLPYADTGQESTFLLGGFKPVRSETLRRIVEQGVDAVPALIKHMGDDRKINMTASQGISVTVFTDQFDFNSRTRREIPQGVSRDLFDDDKDHPYRHSLTVGDLCFVALGQIVNRRYAAVRYVPSGIVDVSSPTYSKRLREAVIQEWKGLTRKQHIQLLVQDFEEPDDGRRMYDAYLRLSYYYPEVVGPLVIKYLDQPTYDADKVSTFVDDRLYKVKEYNQRQKLLADFIRANGKPYEIGIMRHLYSDVAYLQEINRGSDSDFPEAKSHELLVQLFDRMPPVRFADRPLMPAVSVGERASFIRSLTYDKNKQVSEALHRIFLADPKEKAIAPACLLALAKRGDYTNFLVDQLNNINFTKLENSELQLEYLKSISVSRAKGVQDRLQEIARTTANPDYFRVAVFGLVQPVPPPIFRNAKIILASLPEKSNHVGNILYVINMKIPHRSKEFFKEFRETTKSAQRLGRLCDIMNYGSSIDIDLICSLLDDQRQIEGYEYPMRVCDRAADALSYKIDKIWFDTEWSFKRRDEAIMELKKYCATPEK
ncbi:MAG: hypothetical protein CME31_10875 [Gimesia sp.]|uniref:Uncharacterized protein n=1 Tax=Gimesia maris TaxID=122 RepID=A0A3D3R977_9PLAN|nr:hypothetical protein [Gimesia sp.]HCO24642.1 hypothetical protein [Gimesia maris]|tara:strand:- start:68190 stop:69959 length:1770 start_codon:yes stop_codon:yes gene_type:complete